MYCLFHRPKCCEFFVSDFKPDAMEVIFKDLEVSINNKRILHHVSGLARQGHMLAIMGPSGM